MKKLFLSVIPARKGSKGIKNKNIVKLGNKELIYWTINSSIKSKFINKTIVSTNSKKIASISKKYKAEVPFLRPENISNDNSPSIEAVLNIINNENFKMFTHVVLLQPTSPFRNYFHIDEAIKKIIKLKADSLVSVVSSDKPLEWSFQIKNDKIINSDLKNFNSKRRQDLKEKYFFNGAIYVNNIEKLKKYKKFIFKDTIVYEMDQMSSIDIDTAFDLEIAKNFSYKLI